MKPFVFACFCFLAGSAFTQTSIGMTIGYFYNKGAAYSWKDAAAFYPDNLSADSAARSPYQKTAASANSSFMVGANFRIKPTDSTRFMYNWSRNYSLSFGSIKTQKMESLDYYRYDVNTPYTVIYNNDTTTYLLDSINYNTRSLYESGGYGYVSFGMLREIPTTSRIKTEFGFRLSAGMAVTNSFYGTSFQHTEEDSLAGFAAPLGRVSEVNDRKTGTQNVFTGNLSLSAGFIVPLAKDDDTWWVDLHVNVGVGALYAYSKWTPRVNFVPTFGINYRFTSQKDADGYR